MIHDPSLRTRWRAKPAAGTPPVLRRFEHAKPSQNCRVSQCKTLTARSVYVINLHYENMPSGASSSELHSSVRQSHAHCDHTAIASSTKASAAYIPVSYPVSHIICASGQLHVNDAISPTAHSLCERFSTPTDLATETIALSCARCSDYGFPLLASTALCCSLLLLPLYLRLCDTQRVVHQRCVAMNR